MEGEWSGQRREGCWSEKGGRHGRREKEEGCSRGRLSERCKLEQRPAKHGRTLYRSQFSVCLWCARILRRKLPEGLPTSGLACLARDRPKRTRTGTHAVKR